MAFFNTTTPTNFLLFHNKNRKTGYFLNPALFTKTTKINTGQNNNHHISSIKFG